MYAQPLYLQSVKIANQGLHNVVYVATAHGSVYAFDADGKTAKPLWHTSFVNLNTGITAVPQGLVEDNSFPAGELGVIGTPVIDPATGTLYVVAYTDENGELIYRLHALDVTSGAEKLGGPAEIQATVSGTGDETDGHGQVPFDPKAHLQRPSLGLVNGGIYIGFGSHADTWPWHGWLFAYNATSLKQLAVWNTTPNGSAGAIWAAGGAPAADANGNIYVATGNGTFDGSSGGQDYGDSILKLDPQTLGIVDSFTPFNQAVLYANDVDLGSGGPMLLPDQPGQYPHLLVVAGKEGRIYLLNRDGLGGYATDADAGVVQELNEQINPNNLSTPVYWQGNIYFSSENDRLKMFRLTNGKLSDSPTAASTATFGYAGSTPSISANGSSNGIVWAINTTAVLTGGPAQLYAFDATNVAHELYDSTQAGSRDTLGTANKFAVPTVINGKVYVGTATELDVFGLLSSGTPAVRRVVRGR